VGISKSVDLIIFELFVSDDLGILDSFDFNGFVVPEVLGSISLGLL